MVIFSPIASIWCLNTAIKQIGQKRGSRSRNCASRCTEIILHARHFGLFWPIFIHYSLIIRILRIFRKIRQFSDFY